MMLRKLGKKHEAIYALAGFGPGFLALFLSIYIENALNGSTGIISYAPGDPEKIIVVLAIYTAIIIVGRVVDALLNIPLAGLSDNFKTKWGRRRPAILVGLFLLILAYVAMACPWFQKDLLFYDIDYHGAQDAKRLFNTIYFFIMFLVYLFSSSLCMTSYYASIPEITSDPHSRTRLTHWKAAFDTINYSIAYAVLPLVFAKIANMNYGMTILGLAFTPIALTMIIPLIMIKEPPSYLIVKDQYGKRIKKPISENSISGKTSFRNFLESLKISFSNKNYVWWIILFSFFFFGLDLFLLSQTSIASNSMGLSAHWEITVMNSCAFAPIPLMLFLSTKLTRKKGFKFTFCTSLISFIIAVIFFMVAYKNWGLSFPTIFTLSIIGSIFGSFGIGTFFAFPYLVPAQIAAEERQRTGKSNSAIFYGVQGTLVSVSSSLNIPVWFPLAHIGQYTDSGTGEIVYNKAGEIGPHIVTYIILGVCICAFIGALFLPKYFREMGKGHKVIGVK